MKRVKISAAILLTVAAMLPMQSCIGSFALTNKVLDWNRQVGDKFVNELVFVAFWILPVYELTGLADILVINSIEFWKGENPVQASTKVIDGKDAKYLVKSDQKGYTITNLSDNTEVRLNFNATTQSWSVEHDGMETTFMTFVDDTHVRMIAPGGGFTTVELSQNGVMAYQHAATQALFYAMR